MSNPLKPPHVVINPEEDVVTILNTMTGHILVTNQTGESILALCDGEHSEEGIIQAIRAQFQGAQSGEVESDVRVFLQTAISKGIIA